MLNFIQIQNFAIIDSAELELDEGLTVLTGETGAGKSILVDALGLVLGDRADATALRHGAERGEITASFQLPDDAPALHWLAQQDLDDDGECMVRRTLSRSGRSRAFINARAVPLSTLRELGQFLADIHGQNEHQSLLRPPVQRQILDHLGGHAGLLEKVALAHGEWSRLGSEIRELRSREAERSSRLELLQYQVKELNTLAPAADEMAALEEEHRRLSGADKLAEGVQEALRALGGLEDDSGGASGLIGKSQRALDGLTALDASLENAGKVIQEAEIAVSEAVESLNRYLDSLEMDPARLNWVEERIGALLEVARKHKVEPGELPALAKTLADELELLESADARAELMQADLNRAEQNYLAAAARLSKSRKRAAAKMNEDVSGLMQKLGMQGGRFEVKLVKAGDTRYSSHGQDEIEFLVTANPGQPPGPLGKIASGGELSRISLAVQVVSAGAAATGCLVFDEVDSGVGGGVAEIVGRRLRELGESRQVLCVTHLPQVASQSHHHVRVSKLTDGKTTRTSLHALSSHESVEEIARMLGGVEITARTREHAEEMIARAGKG